MPAQTSVMQHPIAIVGVSALFPGSTDATGFWSDILKGKDLLTDVPASHWRIEDYYDANPAAPDKTYAKRGGFLSPIDFDALGWGIPPQTLPATDTAQLLALVLAQSVLQDAARENFATMDRSRISVILGVTSAQELLFSMVSRLQRPVWVKALRESGIAEADVQAACDRIAAQYVPWQEASFPGLLGNVVAGRIANRLNLGGTNCVTDAACASTFSALSMAVNELQLGLSDLVIAGGVDTLNDIFMYMCFSKTPALSPSGDCRPFSDQADGTMLGEGLGMFALKRLTDAERDGDRIYALLRGIGTASDGRSKSVYAPVAAGQAQALRRAYASAGYSARSVELMEAHGTGTKAGDAAEFEGLRTVFGEAAEAAGAQTNQWCALGSVKSQIGHTKAAAGAAGLFKAVMALHHKVLPPSIKIAAPNPSLAIEKSPFYLNSECRPWIRASDHPRRASVSAFGFGGSNFHVTLEEYVPAQGGSGLCAERLATQSADLLLLAAASAAELSLRLRELANKTAPLAKIASDSRIAWDALTNKSYRLAIVASSTQELTQRLAVARARIDAAPEQTFELPDGSCYGIGASDGQVGMLFPGQGSQYLAMGAALAMQFESARQVWDQAANLRMDGETPLHQVVFPRPVFSTADLAEQQAKLTATEWAQPAIGAHSAALLAQLRALGVNADAYAGHSFGELMALHAAGVFSANDAIALARKRGELMRAASGHAAGAMTALSRTHTEVEALIAQQQSDVVIANHNAPKQVVISGTTEAIANFEAKLSQADIEFRRLPVAAAFHSKLVASCCDDFAQSLTEVAISQPTAPVFGNQTGAPFANDAEAIRKQLAAQIANPVRFVEMIHAMHESGVRTFIEVGPGAVLTGLTSTILGTRPHRAIALDRKGRDGVHTLLSGLARLAAAGIAFQARNLFADTRTPPDVVSTGKLMVPINGSNLGKPYPPKDGEYPAPNLATNPPRLIAPVIATPAPAPVPAAMPAQLSTATILSASRAQTPGTQSMTSTPVRAAQNLPASPVSDAWLSAFQAAQAQTAAAQESFQRTLAESHAAYLRLSESALIGLGGLRGNSVAVLAAAHTPVNPVNAQRVIAAPVAAPVIFTPPVVAPSVIPAQAGIQANAGVAAIPLDPRLTGNENTFDLPALLLSVVAEKTGYPVEMLALDMDLEGDLGIDSIKRVEILSSVDERAPHLPKVDRARLSALHTLAEIIAYLGGGSTSAAPATQAAPVIPANAGIQANAGVAATVNSTFDLPSLLLSVVAEKTGYPVEMLALDMDLEGDLGIDSIKRVEILSSVDERAPHLPKVDRARLSALHTLAEIIAYLGGGSASLVPATPAIQAPSVIPAQAGIQANAGVAAIPLDPRLRGDDELASDNDLLGRYTLELIPAPATGFAMPFLLDATPLYLLGHDALAASLALTLRARGVNAHAVATLPDAAIACVYLGGMRTAVDIDAAVAINFEAFEIARTLAAKLSGHGGLFVTVQDSGGDFGLSSGATAPNSAWLAGLPALIKTCALEWPRASVKAIDLAAAGRTVTALAEAIADELLQGGGELEIALKASRRNTLISVNNPVQTGASTLSANDVVLVSGGARGVTAACLSAWAGRESASGRSLRFVLLGRTELQPEPTICAGIEDAAQLKQVLLAAAKAAGESLTPATLSQRVHVVLAGREIRLSIASIATSGAQARYCAVDVQDQVALKRLLQEVRQSWGPIRGLIHAAGVLSDKRIMDKTDAQFAHVFDTKVRGLQALLAATQQDPLRLLCVFSSVSARCGNTGQSDYAMANEVLAKVALHIARTRPELRVKSLGWGPWEAGMVTPQLKARFATLGVPMIPLSTGAAMFADEMNDVSANAVELVLGGEPRAEALLFDGAESRIDALEVQVQRAGHAYLAGHAVNGEPVVPVVLVAEWLARAARSFRPGLTLIALHDLAVLKGIRLGGFEQGGDRFRIEARPAPAETLLSKGSSELQLMLLDSAGRPRYSARAELHAQAALPSRAQPNLTLDEYSGVSPYPDQLFHRDQFELIEQMHGISDAGIAAQVRGVQHANWPEQSWHFDVAALDGGMQLAVLYAQRMLGANNLPTAIASVRHYPATPCAGPIIATAYPRALSKAASTTDIYFVDGNGRRIAELLGVQNHALAVA